MQRRRWHFAIVMVVALAAWSCKGDSTAPDVPGCGAQTTSVQATANVGSTVTFDWSPRCPVGLVLVEDEDGSDMWYVGTPEFQNGTAKNANRIAPSLTYGQSIAGMTGSDSTLPLIAGKTYILALWRTQPFGSTAHCQQEVDNACLLAVLPFTR